MTETSTPPAKVSARPVRTIPVWDIWVRIFHWSFALVVAMAWLSHDWEGAARGWHEWLGYGAAGLVALRIIWGFVGSKYARFSQFVRGPRQMLDYAGALVQRREARYLGHNPLGALMVLFLMALAIGLAITGFVMTHRGMALPGLDRRSLHQLHDVMGNLYVVAVPVHVLAVIFESIRHRENLIGAMILGKKRVDE